MHHSTNSNPFGLKRAGRVFLCLGAAALVTTAAPITAMSAPAQSAASQALCNVGPSTQTWSGARLMAARDRVRAGDAELQPAYDDLIKEADKTLTKGPWSVRSKTKTPPSGDKGDYFSIGPYWWPNPKTEDGLPYVRRDGEVNPERNTGGFDNPTMGRMGKAVEVLALAGYMSGERKYSDRAAEVLRVFFLNPDTRMNPNMNFAQAIPGKTDGRGIGIIDTYRLMGAVESIGMLEESGSLSADEIAGLRKWFSDYSLWLIRSDNGKDERAALNNHGVYYDSQLATFASFAGDTTVVKNIADGMRRVRIPGQIDTKGRMPHELKRTRPYHYTGFTLQAFIDVVRMSDCAGEDLWNYKTGKDVGLPMAMDYHVDRAPGAKTWPYKELRKKRRTKILFGNLCRMSDKLTDPAHIKQLERLKAEHADERMMLIENGCKTPGL